jgi:hypothetical protein
MLSKILRASVFTVALAAAPAYLSAQEAAPAAAPESGAAAPSELQQIQARLTQLQQQALQDPSIKTAQGEILAAIQEAAGRVDPGYAGYAQRAQSLPADVAAAQAASDNAKLKLLADEAKQLQQNIAAAQAKAREDAAVKAKLQEYTVKLFTKMVELDPEAQKLADRMAELQKQ